MNEKLVSRAKKLRKASTQFEIALWEQLRGKQLSGLKFRRQQVIKRYIVDFVCLEKKIIIELDGGQHGLTKEQDRKRDEWLKKEGYQVLRFANDELIKGLNGVLKVIYEECRKRPSLKSLP